MSCCSTCGGVVGGTAVDGCEPCTCTGTPAPYYNDCGMIQEPHCMPVINELFSAAIGTTAAFAMPAISSSAVVPFKGLKRILIGSYLWNPDYGYLEVTDFDYLTGEVTLKNNGHPGNAAAGTVILGCTLFTVVDPPCRACLPSPSATPSASPSSSPSSGPE